MDVTPTDPDSEELFPLGVGVLELDPERYVEDACAKVVDCEELKLFGEGTDELGTTEELEDGAP